MKLFNDIKPTKSHPLGAGILDSILRFCTQLQPGRARKLEQTVNWWQHKGGEEHVLTFFGFFVSTFLTFLVGPW